MSLALEQLSGELAEAGLECTLPFSPDRWEHPPEGPTSETKLCDVSYVDDALFATVVPLASDLPRTAATSASIVRRFFSDRGMQLNFGSGKTEALLVPRGRGAKLVRRELAKAGQLIAPETCSDLSVRTTPRYKHLGGVIDACQNILVEIRWRAAAVFDGLSKVRREIGRSALPLAARLLLVQTPYH